MEVHITTPLNQFNLDQGDIIMTSSKTMLVASVSVNDYRYAFVDLQDASVVEMVNTLDCRDKVNDEIILKVVNNKEVQLILP